MGRGIGEMRTGARFLASLRAYLRTPFDADDGRERLVRQLEMREGAFAQVLRLGVFQDRAGPYRALFDWAGIGLDQVLESLGDRGLEPTLEWLHDAGVRVSWEEFKGRRPVSRPGLELAVTAEDFDNPVRAGQYLAHSGGSTGASRRVLVDLDLLEHESAYHALFLAARRARGRPVGIWAPAPPGVVAMKTALIHAKLGRPVERWFSQSDPTGAAARHRAFTAATVRAIGAWGPAVSAPELTPASEAWRVAGWLADKRADGDPALLATTVSGGVRACTAAMERGLEIEGTLFVLGGEPYTSAKAEVIAEAGAEAACHYAMAEAGAIGIACGEGTSEDDVHLLSDKIATIQRPKPAGSNGDAVQALIHTSLLPTSPKLMLNVDSGDYGRIEQRQCGCGTLPGGFRSHLHTIRSYEKLTSEGMCFLGSDLLTLIEEVLPARFGGRPTDYQLLEQEEGGLTRTSLVVRNGAGAADDEEISRSTLEFLRSRGLPEQLMADVWEQGETLRVVRREPHETPGSKILPLQRIGEAPIGGAGTGG